MSASRVSARRSLVLACSSFVLLACSSKEPPAPPSASLPPPQALETASPAPGPLAVQSTIVPGSTEDFQINVGDRVFFGYDKYDLTDEAHSTLRNQAAWLQRFPAVTLNIEGHSDERGTREYNLALSARRANAAKDYLTSLGINGSRLDTIAYGKDRPACAASNEACWSQNRRGVSVIARTPDIAMR